MLTLRIFLSSTFLDFEWERGVINRRIVPALNEELRPQGLQIDVVDLRWGVSDQAGLDHSTVEICLAEVERCCRAGARPAFMLLEGDREGWRPLPRVIDEFSFAALDTALASVDAQAQACLRIQYMRDANFDPPAYALASRRGQLEEPARWAEVETLIHRGAGRAGYAVPAHLRTQFRTSITAQELAAALAKVGDNVGLIAAMRRHRVTAESGWGMSLHRGTSAAEVDSNAPRWQEIERLLGAAAVTLNLERNGEASYHSRFEGWVNDVLRQAAANTRTKPESQSAKTTSPAQLGIERHAEVDVLDWLRSPNGSVRLLFGVSGSGKTVAMRRLAGAIGDRPTIRLFLGDEPAALDADRFMTRLADVCGAPPGAPTDRLRTALGSSPRTCVFVDAIELVAWREASEALAFLPLTFDCGSQVVISTASEAIRQIFVELFSIEAVVDLGEMNDEESAAQLRADLAAGGRRLTPAQSSAVVATTRGDSGRALTNRVAGVVARRIADAEAIEPVTGLNGWLRALRVQLTTARGQGEPLLDATLALACAARRSVAEADLLRVLGRSTGVAAWLCQAFPHAPATDGLPRTVFARLLSDLDGVVEERTVDGERHFALSHGRLRDALASLLPPGDLDAAHTELAACCLEADGRRFEVSTASAYRLSEVLFQSAHGPAESGVGAAALVGSADFIAAKSGVTQIADTLEDIALLRARGWGEVDVVDEFCEFVIHERVALLGLVDRAERRAYVLQELDAGLKTSALRAAVLANAGARRPALIRQRLTAPKLRGLVPVEGLSRLDSLMIRSDNEIVVGQHDGSITVLGAENGERRRDLRGHPAGAYSGSRLDGTRLDNGRLLSWGADGEVAISSIAAGREFVRMRGDNVGMEYAGVTPAGSIVASSHKAQALYRWDGHGQATGRIDIREGACATLALDDAGLQKGPAARRDSYLPMVSRSASRRLPVYRGGFLVLDDDRIALAGMATFSVWSFQRGPLLLLSQLVQQQHAPKFMLPAGNDIVVVTQNGGVTRIHVEQGRAESLFAVGAKGLGGADPLGDGRIFCWAQRDHGGIEALLLDQRSGAAVGRHVFGAAESTRLAYFRGGASSVPRGLIAFEESVLAWSGYGCESIDLRAGHIKCQQTWGFEHFTTAAVKVDGRHALLLRAGRPVLYDAVAGETIRDFSFLTGEFEEFFDLGGGQIAAATAANRCAFWNLPASLIWMQRQDWGQLGRQPTNTVDARLLPGGTVLTQGRPFADTAWEFELWNVSGPKLEFIQSLHGSGLGALPDDKSDQRKPSGFDVVGPLLLHWGGPPASVALALPEGTLHRHVIQQGTKRIEHAAALFDSQGNTPFPFGAIVCVDEKRLTVVAPEAHTEWQLPAPDEKPIRQLVALGRELLVVTEGGVWLATFPALLPVTPGYRSLAAGSNVAEVGEIAKCTAVVCLDAQGKGIALFAVRPENTDVPVQEGAIRAAVVGFHVHGDAWGVQTLPQVDKWSCCADGVALTDYRGALFFARIDTDVLAVTPLPPGTPVGTPVRVPGGVAVTEHRQLLPLAQPSATLQFRLRLGDSSATLEAQRIVVERDGLREVWFAPDGYVVLDADSASGRLVVRRGVAMQLLECGAVGELAARVTSDLALMRLVQRAGRAEVCGQILKHAFDPGASAHMLQQDDLGTCALLMVEFADAALSLGDSAQAVLALQEAVRMMARRPITGDAPANAFRERVAEAEARLAVLTLDSAGLVTHFMPAGGESAVHTAGARHWLRAALSLFSPVPERLHHLVRTHEAMSGALAGIDLETATDVQANLHDLLELIVGHSRATEVASEDADWAQLLGTNAASELAAALGGDAKACNAIGVRFGRGNGVARNYNYAAWWYERAATGGHAQAAMNLAQMLRHGEGVPRDLKRAFKMTHLAAERGNTFAKCNVGAMLIRGEGCDANPAAARRWLTEAVSEGDLVAHLSLAMMLATGQGGPADPARAEVLLAPLIAQGNSQAIQLLALIHQRNNG